ncbi:MAG TPA: hypothetical protein VKY27_12560 [Bacteriovoracaceae bacterium]|nr:hypothetical protein [Bacteriovoracaceae bacterium]
MKFIYGIILLFSFSSWSQSEGILRCLGLEEARMHENKESGPLFQLNQRLISELVQIPGLRINRVDYRRICGQGNESLKLLEQILIQGKSLFINTQQGMRRSITDGMIDDFIISSKEIFLNFISSIQMISPTPHCLNQHIPELPKLLERIKYLEDEVELQKIFGNKDLEIFKKLQDYPLYFKACEEAKRTDKSGSNDSK